MTSTSTETKINFLWENNRGQLQTKFKAVAKRQLFLRDQTDGKVKCADPNCFMPIAEADLDTSATIHHLKRIGEFGCNFLVYMKLAHLPCNVRLKKPLPTEAISIERKSEGASVSTDPTEVLHAEVEYQSGSPEMQANDTGIPKWMDFMCREIKNNEAVTRHSSLNGGASESGLTYQPMIRAYNKFVYQPEKAGDFKGTYQPFIEKKSKATGKRWVSLREGWRVITVDGKLRAVPETEVAK